MHGDRDREKETQDLRRRYRKLAAQLAATGPILQGTLTERVITRKQGESEKTYGPYYQWTFKSAGKTVTVNLTEPQARLFREAIENNRKLETTLAEMRRLSRLLCESATQGVRKRSPRTPSRQP